MSILLLVHLLFASTSTVGATKLQVHKLGTADFSMVETTPVVWKNELLRFESVRSNYNAPTYPVPSDQPSPCLNQSCFRFRSVSTLAVTPMFGLTCSFGCAYVQKGSTRSDGKDTMWVFGNCLENKQHIVSAFSSTDLKQWRSFPHALPLTGFGFGPTDYTFFNTNVHQDQTVGTHVMAIELSTPHNITGTPFTSVFAKHTGDHLGSGWSLLDPHTHVYPPSIPAHGYKGACPTIRWAKGYYYLFTLWAEKGGYGNHVQRSKDLITWEQQSLPVLDWRSDTDQDKGAPPRIASKFYFTNFTTKQEAFITKSEDINNSDIDFVDVDGDVYISYSWGNQQGTEFLGAAVVRNTTTDQWLESIFVPSATAATATTAATPTATAKVAPPSLPQSFTANIVRHVSESGTMTMTNQTLSTDFIKKQYHIRDYTGGTYYEAWFVQRPHDSPVIYTYSPDNIPGVNHCTCLPTNNISFLPEFLSLATATTDGKNHRIRGQNTQAWSERNEILTNDTYTAYINKQGIPLRTIWIDPMKPISDTTVETSDYTDFTVGVPSTKEFDPNQHCLKVAC